MDTSLIEESLDRYRKMAEQIQAIEKKLHGNDSAELRRLNSEFHALQEAAQSTDQAILAMTRNHPHHKDDPLLAELLFLMRHIHRHSREIASQVRAIMAVQRTELQKIRQGNTLLHGYRPVTNYSGKRISISN